MAVVVSTGARAFLDARRTDEEFLGVCVSVFAELGDGHRIGVDPERYRADGPRRGAGALWGSITVDPTTLPTLDRELFAREPLEAAAQALDTSFVLRPEHVEEFIRSEFADADGDVVWANLVVALRDAGVATTVAALRGTPFRVEFDASLLVELDRQSSTDANRRA